MIRATVFFLALAERYQTQNSPNPPSHPEKKKYLPSLIYSFAHITTFPLSPPPPPLFFLFLPRISASGKLLQWLLSLSFRLFSFLFPVSQYRIASSSHLLHRYIFVPQALVQSSNSFSTPVSFLFASSCSHIIRKISRTNIPIAFSSFTHNSSTLTNRM